MNQEKLKNRDSIIFYRSFFEAIKNLESEKKVEIYDAIFSYSFEEKEPILSGISASIFTLIKPQLEANRKRFENGCKKKKKSKKEAKHKQNISKSEANVNVNVNHNLNENVNENHNFIIADVFDELVFSLKNLIENKLQKKINCRNWRKIIEILIKKDLFLREDAVLDVKKALAELEAEWGNQYFPVVHSAASFREKFSKIEAAIARKKGGKSTMETIMEDF